MMALSSSSPGDPDRFGKDDAVERDHRDLGRAAADVHDHVGGRLVDRQPDPDRGRHRLGTVITLRAPAWVAESITARFSTAVIPEGMAMTTRGGARALAGLLDEVPEHRLGDVESAMTPSFIGRIAVMLPGVRPSIRFASTPMARTFAGRGVERHDRGLPQDDPLVLDVDERVGGAQVDADVVGKITEEIGHSGRRVAPGTNRPARVLSTR